ncbi:(2Fe-2S)-binding protein [Synechocystis sp. LKSZ1]|uniref:(2Fe-2S)-binding protein n=1 Tax=Synechocystis sp. LKSZ1 TaxID=3144951 RepID=UPI00336BC761
MYICICRGITERDIAQAVQQGVSSPEQLAETMGVGADCGCCLNHACQALAQNLGREPSDYCTAVCPS